MYDARIVEAAYTYCGFLGQAQPVDVTDDRTWNVICRREAVGLNPATVRSLTSTRASRTASIPHAITWTRLLTKTIENRPCTRLSRVRFQKKR